MRSSAIAMQSRSGPYLVGCQAVHLGKAVVGDDDALLRVEHRQPLEHVLQCRIEADVLRLQFLLAALQQLVLAGKLCCKILVLGNILMGHNPAAIRARLERGGNRRAHPATWC